MYRAMPVPVPGNEKKTIGDQSGLWRIELQEFVQGKGWQHFGYQYEDGLPYEEARDKCPAITEQMNAQS